MSNTKHPTNRDVKHVLREFADETSIHGVAHIIKARSLGVRIFWSIICVVTFTMVLLHTITLLQRYLSYPKKVNMMVEQQRVQFPWVTVCNTDHLDISVVDWIEKMALKGTDNETYEVPDADFHLWQEAYDQFYERSSAFFQQYLSRISKSKRRNDMLSVYSRFGLTANIGVKLSSYGGVKLSDFIVSCRFMGRKCEQTEAFNTFFDPYYFNCFTFDPSTSLPSQASHPQGFEHGLSLILFMGSAGQLTTKQDEYTYIIPGMEEPDPSLASGQGVHVVVHSPNTEAHPTDNGFNVPPGFSVNFGASMRESVRLPPPYGQCIEGNPNEDHRYTTKRCQNECLQNIITDLCGCTDNRISVKKVPPKKPYCLQVPELDPTCSFIAEFNGECEVLTQWINKMDCRMEVYENMTLGNHDNVSCDCPPPCNEVVYESSYSLSKLPENTEEHGTFYSNVYNFLEGLPSAKKKLLLQKFGDEYQQNLHQYIARVNVHIADSNVIKMTEAPDYQVVDLMSDIGGQMVLWLGISVLSFFELLELLVYVCRLIKPNRPI